MARGDAANGVHWLSSKLIISWIGDACQNHRTYRSSLKFWSLNPWLWHSILTLNQWCIIIRLNKVVLHRTFSFAFMFNEGQTCAPEEDNEVSPKESSHVTRLWCLDFERMGLQPRPIYDVIHSQLKKIPKYIKHKHNTAIFWVDIFIEIAQLAKHNKQAMSQNRYFSDPAPGGGGVEKDTQFLLYMGAMYLTRGHCNKGDFRQASHTTQTRLWKGLSFSFVLI